MIRRRLVFGVVFLMAGTLLVLSPSVCLSQPQSFVEESTQNGLTIRQLNDPTDFGECAGQAGLISITVGIGLFANAAISATRRRPLGD